MERYQAEALVYGHVPVEGLLGIVCYTEAIKRRVEKGIKERGLDLPVHARARWYF
ncbi:hypothetical protein D3C78_1785140 [compost metagenome]